MSKAGSNHLMYWIIDNSYKSKFFVEFPYAQKPRPVALTWICDKIGDPAKDATDAPDPASDAPLLLLTCDIASPFSTPLLHIS